MTYSTKQYDSVCNDYMHLLRAYEELKTNYTKLNASHTKLVGTHRNLKVCHANLSHCYDEIDSEMDRVEEENKLLNTAWYEFALELDEKTKENKALKKRVSKEKKSNTPIADYDRLLNMLENGVELRRSWKIDGISYVFQGRIVRDEHGKAYIVANSKKYKTIEKWAAAIQKKLVKRNIISEMQKEDIGRQFMVHEPNGLVYALQILN